MKKMRLLFMLAVVLLCNAYRTQAQITSVAIDRYSGPDTLSYRCVPAKVDFFITGKITGTYASTDSLDVSYDFGDGTDTTFKRPLYGAGDFAFFLWDHPYSTSGTYTTKLVITAPGGAADSVTSDPFYLSDTCAVRSVAFDPGSSFFYGAKKCIPTTVGTYYTGTITGSLVSDSLTVSIDYGDGTVKSFGLGVYDDRFFYGAPTTHSYTTAGIYTPRMIISASSGAADTLYGTPDTVNATCPIVNNLKSFLINDSTIRCVVPYSSVGYIYGEVSGTLSATDSVLINVNFGDGSDTTFKLPLYTGPVAGGDKYYETRLVLHTYSMTGTYKPVAISSVSGFSPDTLIADSVVVMDTCATVHGKLFLDADHDCTADAGEEPLINIPILVEPAGSPGYWIYGWSSAAGEYAVNLYPGSYKITPMAGLGRYYATYSHYSPNPEPTCPSSGSVTMSVAASTDYIQDFAYECAPLDSVDVSVTVTCSGFIPGDTSVMTVWAGAYWSMYYYLCLNIPTSVTLTLDAHLSYAGHTGTGIAPSSVSGSVITWNLTGAELSGFYSSVKVAVDTSVALGDTLKSTAYIAPPAGYVDPVTSNNTFVYSGVASSSYDPNMKEVAPKGSGAKGIIAANTPMTYTIHFQNTGTAPAKNVIVVDTLPATLDMNSFHVLASTHNQQVYRDGNVVKFRFSNINLPDSGSNYFSSMGSVTYAVMQQKDLAPGTEIRNRAGIYFDYNAPVITNYTLNTIASGTAIQEVKGNGLIAHIFPNPAHTELNVSMDNKNEAFTVTMTDMLGRVVSNTAVRGAVVIPTQQLPAGLYLLSIKDGNGRALNTKVMVQH